MATPGAGKTTFALTAARHEPAAHPSRLVVAPTAHLKLQWARAAAAFSPHLDPAWSPAEGPPPADMHGIVTSYQQVASNARVLARVARGAAIAEAFAGSRRVGGDRELRRLERPVAR